MIHQGFDKMNTHAAQLPAFDVARRVGVRVGEGIELDAIVLYGCAEMLPVRRHVDFDEMLVVVRKCVDYDVGEHLIERDGHGSANFMRKGESGTELVERA